MKKISLDEITDKHIGKKGSEKREIFDNELQLEILADTIRQIRKEKNMTQQQLGDLVGVKKAQISKIEHSLTNARFETILKIFRALNIKLNFNLELMKS